MRMRIPSYTLPDTQLHIAKAIKEAATVYNIHVL